MLDSRSELAYKLAALIMAMSNLMEVFVLNRMMLILLVALLVAAIVLDVAGITPGMGRLAIPFLILLAAVFVLLRSFQPTWAASAAAGLDVPLDGTRRASLDLKLGAGDLVIRTDAPANVLLSGQCVGSARYSLHETEDGVMVKLRQPFTLWSRRRADWQIALSAAVEWEHIRLTLGVCVVELDLADLAVATMRVETVRTTLNVTLPRAGEVALQSAGGKATVRVPTGAYAEIHSTVRIGELEVDAGRFMPIDPGSARAQAWVTSDGGESPDTLRLVLEGGLCTIEVA